MSAIATASKQELIALLMQQVVQQDNGCWRWNDLDKDSYGYFAPMRITAHRAAWELLRGPIPDGLVIDHLCRNKHCCNPDHLEPVTKGENTRRGKPRATTGEDIQTFRRRRLHDIRLVLESFGIDAGEFIAIDTDGNIPYKAFSRICYRFDALLWEIRQAKKQTLQWVKNLGKESA